LEKQLLSIALDIDKKKMKTLTPFALLFHHKHQNMWTFISLAYQGNEIALIFIIEYSSLRDLGPSEVIGLFLYEDFFER
jgi:hypothetical protein